MAAKRPLPFALLPPYPIDEVARGDELAKIRDGECGATIAPPPPAVTLVVVVVVVVAGPNDDSREKAVGQARIIGRP